MEASQIFKEILNKIESSQLNYVISKTPFSANIVIKSSFIKYYDATSFKEVKGESETRSSQKDKINSDLVSLNKQNMKLKDLLQSEKNKVKSLEDQIGEFRENLLDIKKEKNDLNYQLKSHKTQLADLEIEQRKMQEIKKDLEAQIVVKNKNCDARHHEIKVINKENVSLNAKLDQCLSELDSLKLETKLLKEKQGRFECNLCDMIFESRVDLSQHVRDIHVKHQVSQTRIKEVEVSTQTKESLKLAEYPCFYCGQTITSSEPNLAKHLPECSEMGLAVVNWLDEHTNSEPKIPKVPLSPTPHLSSPPLLPPHLFSPLVGFQKEVSCYNCNEKFPHEVVLKKHYEQMHPEIILFWCNVCWTNFGSERGLQSNMRNAHKKYT